MMNISSFKRTSCEAVIIFFLLSCFVSSGLCKEDTSVLISNLRHEDITIKQAAINVLINLGDKAVDPLLEELENTPAIGVKGSIIFILGCIKDRAATKALMGCATDENSYVRKEVTKAFAKIKDPDSLEVLTHMLSDDNDGVRAGAAQALGELSNAAAVKDLLERLTDEKQKSVKVAIIDALGKLGDARATEALLVELSLMTNRKYKDSVVFALGEIGDRWALPRLTDYLNQLQQKEPSEALIKFSWMESVVIAKEAIEKIKSSYGAIDATKEGENEIITSP